MTQDEAKQVCGGINEIKGGKERTAKPVQSSVSIVREVMEKSSYDLNLVKSKGIASKDLKDHGLKTMCGC